MTNAVFHVAEKLHSLGFEGLAEVHSDCIEGFICMSAVLEKEGHIEQSHLRLEGPEFGSACKGHVHCAIDQPFDELFLCPELRRWEYLDLDFAFGLFVDQLG